MIRFLTSLALPSWVLPAIMAGIVAAGLSLSYAYLKGYSNASAKCEAASLRAQIAGLERDIEAMKAADALEAEEVAKLGKLMDDYEAEIAAYEIELATKPDDRCIITPADADRLRGDGKRKAPAR